MTDVDVVVLGLGPGGEAAASALASAGRAVVAIDPRLVGGECPYFGCIPSKMILRGAEVLRESRRIPQLSGSSSDTPDFGQVARRIRDEATDNWDDTAAVDKLTDAGARFVRAAGRLAGRADDGRLRVEADGETFLAPTVLVATGTSPTVPPIDGLADLEVSVDGPVWTNREILQATEAPTSMVVIGGGAIGCELAQGFARYGTRVTIVEGAPHLLMKEEPEAGQVVAEVFEREGITVVVGRQVSSIARGGDGVQVTLEDGSTHTGAKLLVAAGRRTNLDLGLDSVGLDASSTALEVDEHMAVAGVDGLFAIGDVTGIAPFTHVSMWQSQIFTAHVQSERENFGGYHGLAWATFTDPEVGRVGRTEQEARDAGLNVRVGTQQIASDTRGWIHGPGNDGFVKVVEDADRGVLVGGTVTGPYGGEIVGLLTLAVHAEVPTTTLLSMFYVFPALHRSVLEALQALA